MIILVDVFRLGAATVAAVTVIDVFIVAALMLARRGDDTRLAALERERRQDGPGTSSSS